MLKVNQFVAQRLESYSIKNFQRKVGEQYINHVKVLSYITDEQLKQHKGDNRPVQVSTLKLAKHLGVNKDTSHRILNTLEKLAIIIKSGYCAFVNKDTRNTDIEPQAYSYSFGSGCGWLGVYLELDKSSDQVSLPNEPFYNQYIHNLKQISDTWYYNTSFKEVLGYRLVFPETSINTIPIQPSIISSCSNTSGFPLGNNSINYSVLIKEEKSEENRTKNPSYSLETQKNKEIKKCKKREQIKLNNKVLKATQPHKESRVYTNLTSMKREKRSSLRWGPERYQIKQADLHAAQIYLAFAMFLQSGGIDDKMAHMLTEVDFYNTMIEDTGWEGAWMWNKSIENMEWVTGRKGFQRYFFSEILYSTCEDMRSSKWGTEVFRRRHSDFWQFIYDAKNDVGNDAFSTMKDNARLAHRMAVLEWDHMRATLEFLYEDGYPAVNLHDAIVFPEVVPDSAIVDAIRRSFSIYPLLPKIKTENL
jgi:hypothetical protein